MDFRDPNTIGMFPYHCHLLEHEDKGMMGSIRVDPPASRVGPSSEAAAAERSHLKPAVAAKYSQR
jgi:hypothetical protein